MPSTIRRWFLALSIFGAGLGAVAPAADAAAATAGPEIVSFSPADGSTDAATGARITIRFSEPVRVVGNAFRTIRVGDPARHRYVCLMGRVSRDGRTLRLWPTTGCSCPLFIQRHAWQAGHDYEVWVGGNVRSRRTGAPLASAHWTFTVAG